MKQVELRLALVFYGGVSLAIYMHGVSREVLNLVKASACHGAREAPDGTCADLAPSVRAYLDLFEAFEPEIKLRVVVDAIAGASAGGVNGIMLARAIAHDLPLESHRDLWLANADVTRLAKPQDGLTRYLKSGMSPVFDRMITSGLKSQIESVETREKLRLLTQSRWFTPPFSGSRFIGWMLDACAEMDKHWREGATLVPRGQTLDLFVTLTDYHGKRQRITLDDPAFIEEWEHRRILKFSCRHRTPGMIESALEPHYVPDLVFAARATSSFPGAFAPATIGEMDAVLEQRGEVWFNRAKFIRDTLGGEERDMMRRCFVDGSVVMNKPFAPVIEAIEERPAMREVVRRLVYVDPAPSAGSSGVLEGETVPGFFRVILASLAHIPRNEPVGDDLKAIEAKNRRARRLGELISAADPLVEAEVNRLLPPDDAEPPTVDELAACRAKANEVAHAQAGYAYLSYQTLKLQSLAERLAALIAALAHRAGVLLSEEVAVEAIRSRLREVNGATGSTKRSDTIIGFLRGLDVDYRIRRLRFVVRKLNGFYQVRAREAAAQNPDDLDALKSELYEQVDRLTQRWSGGFYASELCELAAAFARSPTTGTLGTVLDRLATAMDLGGLDRLHDDIFAVMTYNYLVPSLRQALTRAYVGFAFYDLVTLPVFQRNDFSEVNETLVDRISPNDATLLCDDGFALKGLALNMFGAFFNRSWREHDYLWGRLSAADRLVGIIQSSIGARRMPPEREQALRKKLFLAILEEERDYLTADPDLIAQVRALVEARFRPASAA
ncbi:patatin-like protein [Polymorphum gilvum]|nr:patatin-like protein [Polymorphum gilvum]